MVIEDFHQSGAIPGISYLSYNDGQNALLIHTKRFFQVHD